jgi:diguanylate cyclase (GGDEF)-like protein
LSILAFAWRFRKAQLVAAQKKELEQANRLLEDANRELENLSVRDGLTGLYNRRYFDETLNEEVRRAVRNGNPLALLMIDIDYFKKFNDTHGHLSGDAALQKTAEAIEQAVGRTVDVTARYGGEEFAVILADTDLPGALRVAEKIHGRVREISLLIRGKEEKITVSIGVHAGPPKDSAEASEYIRLADEALYRAKEGGRNRTKSSGD